MAGTGHKPGEVIVTTDSKIDPKTQYVSITAGDLLMVPLGPPCIEEEATFHVTVLRIDSQGGIYLSRLSKGNAVSVPNTVCNPFRWSDEKGALVDCDDDVPFWYNTEIVRVRGGAQAAAAQYAAIPRVELVSCQVTEADHGAFMDNPLAALITGINQNGEAGSLLDRTSLVLDVLGIPHSQGQLLGLTYHLFQQIRGSIRVTVVPVDLGSSDSSAEGRNPLTH